VVQADDTAATSVVLLQMMAGGRLPGVPPGVWLSGIRSSQRTCTVSDARDGSRDADPAYLVRTT
jgi:hypothetical protein